MPVVVIPKVSLKVLAKDKTKIEDFCLEIRYSRMFCKHPSVIGEVPMWKR